MLGVVTSPRLLESAMKSFLACLLLAILPCGFAFGQDSLPEDTGPGVSAVDVSNLPDGYYVLRLFGGGATVQPVRFLNVSPSPTPPPAPPAPIPPVPTPSLSPRSIAIRDAVLKITGDLDRDATALAIGAIYTQIGKHVAAGSLRPDDAVIAIRGATSLVVDAKSVGPVWQPVRDLVSEQWSAVARDGGGPAEYATLLTEISDGLSAAAPKKQLSPEVIAILMQLLQLVLSLITE